MNHYSISYGANPVTSSESMYTYAPAVKQEYLMGGSMCMQQSTHWNGPSSSAIPVSTNGIYPSSVPSTMQSTVSPSTANCSKQVSMYVCVFIQSSIVFRGRREGRGVHLEWFGLERSFEGCLNMVRLYSPTFFLHTHTRTHTWPDMVATLYLATGISGAWGTSVYHGLEASKPTHFPKRLFIYYTLGRG